MWRTYLAVFLLAGMLAAGYTMHHYTSEQALTIAEQIPVSLSDPQAEAALDQAHRQFQRRSTLFSTFYVHTLVGSNRSFKIAFPLRHWARPKTMPARQPCSAIC